MLEFEVVSLDEARLKTASGSRGVREYVIQRLRGNLFGMRCRALAGVREQTR